jgi:CRISPR-associated protein Cas5t
MRVLRVELEAPVCSFRYPHFLVGRQLTFDMPPPSTIFGHIASALGEWPDPRAVRFAYHFTSAGTGEDLEHQHIVTPTSARPLPGGEPSAVNASVQPTRRQFLLGARLTLYLDRLDYRPAFEVPAFPVALGRSQDLASYTRVDEVELERSDRGYFEHTILPFEFRTRTGRGVTILMPRYIAPPPARDAAFERFVVLREPVYQAPPEVAEPSGNRRLLSGPGDPLEVWVDPESPERAGMRRVVWLTPFLS